MAVPIHHPLRLATPEHPVALAAPGDVPHGEHGGQEEEEQQLAYDPRPRVAPQRIGGPAVLQHNRSRLLNSLL